MLSNLYNILFYEPLYNTLVFLTGVIPFGDLGIAIVVLTILVKFILFPLSHKSIVTQVKMRKLEPDIKAIKDKYKKDNAQQSKKVMELYSQHGINPFSGCLMILIQLPIIFALYKLFLSGLDFDIQGLYSFISLPENIKTDFLGLINLSSKSYFLAATAGISQFFQMKLAIPPLPKKSPKDGNSLKDDFARSMNLQTRYIMPLFIFFMAFNFSAAIALYWTTMNLFAIVHELAVRSKADKIIHSGETKRNNQTSDKRDTGENDNLR